ncbi:MAG: NAD-dependent succinate-semialdehyde dehydrogenase [Chloroflexi bacterium]|nr:NAD-dependent succinate-semialdehyde dehydrogenase [Chloroflexota bacterium]
MGLQSTNPATEEVLACFDEFTPAQIEQALAEAAATFPAWRRCTFAERGELMRRAAAYLRVYCHRFARLITLEMGKPIAQAEAEIEKCAWNCDFYAQHAERFLADQPVRTNARSSYVAFEPLGVILAVMPWNFPFWQVFRFAAPTLMAGNTAVLKHASNVPQCALAIEEVFQGAGFPPGAFRTLLVSAGAVEPIIADPRVRAVTLTGSTGAGARIGELAGRYLKKSVLELGGSDPFIVLEDADLQAAAELGVQARFKNTGQSCSAAKRFIVVEAVADEFERRFVQAAAKLQMGDPLLRQTQLGPLARPDLRDQLERQVQTSVAQGARLVLGGRRLDGRGYFFAPTVLSEVTRGIPVWQEETFGPVAALARVSDTDEAIALANASLFGLGASLWTADWKRGQRLARQIEAGSVFVNGVVASDPRLPFGGLKASGHGRELGEFGIREFVNLKTIWIGPSGGQQVPRPSSE